MAPTLLPGDWILVDPSARGAAATSVVIARDPEHAGGWLVKRVAGVRDARVTLVSDSASGRTYSVPATSITGRAWFRYWPPARIGRIR